ncbi:hypothetical protein D3C78_1327780 [compost metagenome]
MHSLLFPFARQYDLAANRQLLLQKMPIEPHSSNKPLSNLYHASQSRFAFSITLQNRYAAYMAKHRNLLALLHINKLPNAVILIAKRKIIY